MPKATVDYPAIPSTTEAAALVNDRAGHGEFLNRELTWLDFNRRVLNEALDERTPLLERAAFLAIFNSNLDEFFQKRVGGLKRQIAAGLSTRTPDGMTPQEQLTAIRAMVLPMLDVQATCFSKVLKPLLAKQNVHLLAWEELTDEEKQYAADYFEANLFPVLTPLAVDPGHPFPFISNLSTSLGVILRNPAEAVASDDEDNPAGGMHFARVKVPAVLPPWIRLQPDGPSDVYRYIRLEEVIRHNLQSLFEGMEIVEVQPFRITRNADVERDEEDADDLLELIEQELRDRRFANVIRLETEREPFHPLNNFLMRELNLSEEDVYEMPGELDYNNLWGIHSISEPGLKYDPWTPLTPPRLADDPGRIFEVIRDGDIMVHHPYEAFGPSVAQFIRKAANDPKVVAIKLTLYRTDKDSPFIPHIIKAAESGKQVVVLVELKARFDEERNVQLAQQLEKAGVHVVYGVVGFKTHTKTSMVIRQERDGMRVYAHIGTGNYNSKTANLYTDIGLFTCDRRLTDDLVQVFHFLTGRAVARNYKHLLIAPRNMRSRFEEMIAREIANAADWKKRGSDPDDPNRPLIIAKMNSLEDLKMCRKLYKASQAGVRVKLIVRGFCCLRPGVKGMSENITVQSVIGRFLEHSRIYYFHNNGSGEYFVGSADWMYRNLNNRVECITPILEPAHQARLKQILDIMLADQRQAWDMHPDGSYTQRSPKGLKKSDPRALGTQQALMDLYRRDHEPR